MSTIRRVASEADVSIATVSRVLNNTAPVSEEVRGRVLKAASRLGYAGSRRSINPIANYVALAYTGRCSVSSPYDVALLDGMSAAADGSGFDIVVIRLQVDRKPGESYSQMLQRKGARAALIRTHADTREICRELAAEGYPCIVLGDSFGDEPVNYAYCDSRASSYQAVEHLISLGHRRIAAAISHVPDHDHNERMAGYQSALEDHGIEFDPKLIHRVWALRPNGAQVVRTLMSVPDRPTAIFITDPLVAVGAINQAHVMGVKIPEDLSIIGFDDADMRENVYPKMSAICQDAKLLGHESMMAITQMLLDHPAGPIHKVLPTWLELHGTTGQPPAQCMRVLPDGNRVPAVGLTFSR